MTPSNISISFGDIIFYTMRANDSCYQWIPYSAKSLENTAKHMVDPKDYDNMDELLRDIFNDTKEGW